MDVESWKELHNIIRNITTPLISLAGVWLGWHLSTLSQRRQRRLDSLQKRLDALREVMSVVNNIPPDVDITKLQARFAGDPDFFRNIANRLVRLFGLRTEFAPFLEPEIRRYIDNKLRNFYMIGGGRYELLPEKKESFAQAAIELRRLANKAEERLILEYQKLTV